MTTKPIDLAAVKAEHEGHTGTNCCWIPTAVGKPHMPPCLPYRLAVEAERLASQVATARADGYRAGINTRSRPLGPARGHVPAVNVERQGVSALGAPIEYLLDQACLGVMEAFDERPYLVGSAMEKGDWRDVDVRVMLDDDKFDRLFLGVTPRVNPLWKLLCVTVSEHLSRVVGLPVDFQVQRIGDANEKYTAPRHPLCLHVIPEEVQP